MLIFKFLLFGSPGIATHEIFGLCLSWFADSGYDYVYGPDIAPDGESPERSDYKQILLTGRLLDALQRINPHIPVETLQEQVVHLLGKPESPVLIRNNLQKQGSISL